MRNEPAAGHLIFLSVVAPLAKCSNGSIVYLTGQMENRTVSMQPKDVGLELSRTELYPPYLSESVELVNFTTAVPGTDILSFDYTVNGIAAHFAGVGWFSGHNKGHFRLDRQFMASYAGSWPVRFEVRAFRSGTQVDSAVALLHDTRRMECTRVEMDLVITDTVEIPTLGNEVITVVPRFYDAAGILLPTWELDWHVALPVAVEGVTLDGDVMLIDSSASPGQFSVVIHGPNGLNQSCLVTLI